MEWPEGETNEQRYFFHPHFFFLRRSWSGNAHAQKTIRRTMEVDPRLQVTLPNAIASEDIIQEALKSGENK